MAGSLLYGGREAATAAPPSLPSPLLQPFNAAFVQELAAAEGRSAAELTRLELIFTPLALQPPPLAAPSLSRPASASASAGRVGGDEDASDQQQQQAGSSGSAGLGVGSEPGQPLRACRALVELSLVRNGLRAMPALGPARLTLVRLVLSEQALSSMAGLGAMPALRELDLSCNSIT